MKEMLNFLMEVGKLKGKKRRGWLIHKIKDAETTAEHIFHLAILVWILGRNRKLDLERAIMIALVHDLCEIYSLDLTSFDAAALPEKGKITQRDIFKIKPRLGRPTTLQRRKMEKIKQKLEEKAIKKLIARLPSGLKEEISNLWTDFEKGLTKEGRFVKQADKLINLLQGLLYWRRYGKIQYSLWLRRAKEVLDDPDLLELLNEIEKEIVRKKLKQGF